MNFGSVYHNSYEIDKFVYLLDINRSYFQIYFFESIIIFIAIALKIEIKKFKIYIASKIY